MTAGLVGNAKLPGRGTAVYACVLELLTTVALELELLAAAVLELGLLVAMAGAVLEPLAAASVLTCVLLAASADLGCGLAGLGTRGF